VFTTDSAEICITLKKCYEYLRSDHSNKLFKEDYLLRKEKKVNMKHC
jgi:hypothetical protein